MVYRERSAAVGSPGAACRYRRRPARWSAVLGALWVAAVGAGCGSGSSGASPAADSAYLSEVHDSAPDIASQRSDTQLIRLGHAVCDGFAAGASYVVLADRLALQEGSHALPSQDLGAVITAAVDAYCPKFHDRTS